ncbi:NucA/NucB deoxyribonuclease domain-containing protein [Actinomadura litoris]|uniref:NucA/NucB deoxyribonuclease domain-containing protein n=1 Tax=Actinomadura litoris TaxID=2678616 RepID=UPI001FA6DB71|nr:NucA/NucB deoxyribonuclease domain-containing protein [Actinomadura litoris]
MKLKTFGRIAVGAALIVNVFNSPAIADETPSGQGSWSLTSEANPKGSDAKASHRTLQDVINNAKQHSYTVDSQKYSKGHAAQQEVAPASQIEECAGTIIGNPRVGYLKDRYHFCSNWSATINHIQDGVPDGGYTFDVIFIGTAYQSTRKIDYEILIDRMLPWGDVSSNPNPTISFRVDCYEITGIYGCDPKSHLQVSKTVAEWSISPHAQMWALSDYKDGVGPDKVNLVGWDLFMNAPDLPGAELEQLQVSQTGRFDSASYIPNYPQGSVFPEVTPHLLYKTSDAEVNETAQHIKDACEDPANTIPTVPNKDIPGCRTDNVEKAPIYRLFHDSKRRTDNRSMAVRTCEAKWPGYPSEGKDCDEFPFASTYEGAAIGEYEPNATPGMYSVRALTSSDNQEAGTRLGVWYTADRILDGRLPINGAVHYFEPFKVWIK